MHDQWRNDPLVATAFAPHAPYTVSDANFERIRMLPTSSTCRCIATCTRPRTKWRSRRKTLGQRPLARLDRLGLVNDRLIAVHMTQLTDAEIALCAERGVSVAHCPESNLKLASGFCPVAKLATAPASTSPSAPTARRATTTSTCSARCARAALLAKGVGDDASAFDAFAALRAATLGGAKALGFEHLVGSIEAGKQADLVCVDLAALETQPLHHVVSQLVYACGRHQVTRRVDRRPAQAGQRACSSTWTPTQSSPTRASGATASPRSARRNPLPRLR